MRIALFMTLVLAACGGGNSDKKAGESCVASTECGAGLVCDFGAHVCANMGSLDAFVPPVDGDMVDAPKVDGRPIDARPIDARPIDAPPDMAIDAPPDTM